MKTPRKKNRRNPSPILATGLFYTQINDSVTMADMRERVRLFGTTPLRFA